MENKSYTVRLPEEVVSNLSLESQETLELKVENQKIVIKRKKPIAETQTISLRWFLIPSVIASLIFCLYFFIQQTSQIPLTGDTSIASLVIILGLVSGILSFTTFFIRGKKNEYRGLRDIYWRNFPTLLISFAIILILVVVGFFWIVGVLFEGAKFDLFTATIIAMVFLSTINYLMIYFVLSISPQMITTLLVTVIVGGVLLAMISNSQLQWWQINFSFLGTDKANSSWQFNLTLIISALLMLALVDYLFVSLQKSLPKNIRLSILRTLLTLTAIDLGGVGFFPNNGTGQLHFLHNQAANFLVYLILILIVSIRWLMPKVTKEFLAVSYIIGAVLFVANILFQTIGYLSLTAFELIAFFLAFSWILLLIQNLQKITKSSLPTYAIKLTEIKEDI
ncbi:hypothetical protein IGI37_001744 [Enterococcus sp. AZ194]|uniref:DUF998 domain-containing protein n=1 Tax=Enterococcus sp. AZ194 TaxID=2774629 RepID=UPI003F25F3FC